MVILRLSILLVVVNSYKILVVNPKIGYSHMNFMGKIADTLADAGHDVVTLQPTLFPYPSNGTTKSFVIQTSIGKDLQREFIKAHYQKQHSMWTASCTNPVGVIGFAPTFARIIAASVSSVLDDDETIENLKSEKFDVGITELFDFTGIAVFEAIGLKNMIGTHASNSLAESTAYAIGAPVIPSFMPASQGITGDSTSLSTRAVNFLFTVLSWYFQKSAASAAESMMMKKLGKTATPIWECIANMPFILTNADPYLDFPKPTLHKVIDLGGIGIQEPKALSKEWDRILGLRSQTVLISSGSVARSNFMPIQIMNAIVEVAKSIPKVTFIWKYEDPDNAPFAAGIRNLVLSAWTPQSDLLADNRLTLFVTHGGAGSLMESAFRGKPLVVVPLFADQTRNAKLVVKFGFGMMLDKKSLSDSKVISATISRVLNDSRYQKAAQRVRNILAKQTLSPQQKLVKAVELAAEFGQMPELRVAGRDLGVIAYYNLDIYVLLIISIALILACMIAILRLLVRLPSVNRIVKIKKQ
ncbi:unnamed protein product [Cylicocyclus nassatus]|uniref:UDP-glucuronosyltransferase n=1 Tax=Cylicocyclus nassatus TaxID=53992 RepID=A0AA36H4C6_CYLNA|nr:unnamed protein product [Cylicocyclus nassatus]